MKNKINALLFKDKINFIFSSRKITRKILVIGLLVFFSCFFTLSAQESSSNNAKIGFYAGIVPPIYIAGQGKIESKTTATTSAPGFIPIVETSKGSGDESINGGIGFKLGYRFPEWRLSLNQYNFEFADDDFAPNVKSSLTLIIADYLHQSGFFVGFGIGTGTVENSDANFSESGSATAINLGYNIKINEQANLGIGYLSSSFNYEDNSSRTYSCNAGICTVETKVENTFSITTLYSELTYAF